MKYFIFAFFIFSILGSFHGYGQNYTPLTHEEEADFLNQLRQAVIRAEDTVKRLQDRATDRQYSPTWSTKSELDSAIVQLEVKKTLFNNFKGTESLRSLRVRRKLLDTFNKPILTTSDLADLQSIVLDEKAKIQAEDRQVQSRMESSRLNSTPIETTPRIQKTEKLRIDSTTPSSAPVEPTPLEPTERELIIER